MPSLFWDFSLAVGGLVVPPRNRRSGQSYPQASGYALIRDKNAPAVDPFLLAFQNRKIAMEQVHDLL